MRCGCGALPRLNGNEAFYRLFVNVREWGRRLIRLRIHRTLRVQLHQTLIDAPIRPEYPFEVDESGPKWHARPGVWIGIYLGIASYLLFVVLW